jgi:hypothetical protein
MHWSLAELDAIPFEVYEVLIDELKREQQQRELEAHM